MQLKTIVFILLTEGGHSIIASIIENCKTTIRACYIIYAEIIFLINYLKTYICYISEPIKPSREVHYHSEHFFRQIWTELNFGVIVSLIFIFIINK